ncbi:MAG: MoaD/ThiS family protein [Spirochaetaceae bacterium]|nr:MoaD/ThiS family protein [Spirochaetaceae bacterium]
MKVRVRLFASLRAGRFAEADFDLAEGAVVAAALGAAGVPEAEAAILFLNSRHVLPGDGLRDGDSLAVFPPVGGG